MPEIKIESVLGGWSPLKYFNAPGQYRSSIGIDPDFPVDDSEVGSSGFIRPTAMSVFSGATLNSTPLWILTDPKSSTIYVYTTGGRVVSYSSSFASETNAASPTSGAGNGAAYYDNYHYFATPTQIFRYGPLNGSPALSNALIANSELLDGWNGGSDSLLTNTTYPAVRGITLPNHVMHRHVDNKLYVCDVLSDSTANTNRGAVHFIKTSKTTVEGDTDADSTYNALDLPYGMYPTTLASYGTDLVIAAIEGTNTTIKQKPAAIYFWDTTSVSFQRVIQEEFPDPLITAMLNVNGMLYVFSGNASGGCRISRLSGTYSLEEVAYLPDMLPPLQGAVDAEFNKIVFGGYTTDPEASGSVYSLGSKITGLGKTIHNIFRSTSAGSTPWVTAVKFVEHASFNSKRPIIGWKDASGQGLDKISTTYSQSNFWESPVYRIGQPFVIHSIYIPLAQAVAANMTLTPKLFFDNESTSLTCKVINSTNYPNSERFIMLTPTQTGKARGLNDFFLQLKWSGSSPLLTVKLPITIVYDLEKPKNAY